MQQWSWRGIGLWGVILLLCAGLGGQFSAWGQEPAAVSPGNLRLGAELYIQNCGRCHVAVPAQVLPTETWRVLVQDTNHYGVQLQPLPRLDTNLITGYLRTFSRSIRPGESVPYRVGQSRFFRALHPGVELSQPVGLGSCITCHPGAARLNYQQISPNQAP